MKEKEHIKELLEDALPLVDFDSDFLFSELDSLGVTTILMVLSDAYGIRLEATDATPRNLKSLDSLEALVESNHDVSSGPCGLKIKTACDTIDIQYLSCEEDAGEVLAF